MTLVPKGKRQPEFSANCITVEVQHFKAVKLEFSKEFSEEFSEEFSKEFSEI